MAYTFTSKPVVTVRAKVTGTDDAISVQGTNPASTPDDAKTQIDRILALVGDKKVDVKGMTRTRTEEAVDNG